MLDRAAGRVEQPGGDPQQRRLAAPGRADDRDELARARRANETSSIASRAVGERHPDVVEGDA